MMNRRIQWFISILFGVMVMSCSSPQDIPNPNPPHPVYDLPHYRRDTLNFYQVDLNSAIEESIDSILTKCGPPLPHLSWILTIQSERRGKVLYSLSLTSTSNVFIELDENHLIYKSAIVSGVQILIIDHINFIGVNLDKPLIKVWNRKLHSGYSHVSYSSWFFEMKGRDVRLESTWGVY